MAVVENDHYSPFELKNVTSRVNTVSNDLFESNEKKIFWLLDAIINHFLKIRSIGPTKRKETFLSAY